MERDSIASTQKRNIPSRWKRIAFAAKIRQQNAGFQRVEEKLQRRCEGTMGGVTYIPPLPTESLSSDTQKRRQKMMNNLIPYMSTGEKRIHSAKMQAHGKFQRAEQELEGRCHLSLGPCAVRYEGPSDTELWTETRVRRKRMCRKLARYYRFQIQTMKLMRITPLMKRSIFEMWNKSFTTNCKLGTHRCPCRSVRHSHTFFTWHLTDVEFEWKLHTSKACLACYQPFWPTETRSTDLLFRICSIRKDKIDMSSSGALVSDSMMFANIKMWLMPRLDRVLGPEALMLQKLEKFLDSKPGAVAINQGRLPGSVAKKYSKITQKIMSEVDAFILQRYVGCPLASCPPETPARTIKDVLDSIQARSPEKTDISIDPADYGFPRSIQLDEEEELLLERGRTRGLWV